MAHSSWTLPRLSHSHGAWGTDGSTAVLQTCSWAAHSSCQSWCDPCTWKKSPLVPACLFQLTFTVRWSGSQSKSAISVYSQESFKTPNPCFLHKTDLSQIQQQHIQRTHRSQPKNRGKGAEITFTKQEADISARVLLSHWSASGRITQEINSLLKVCKLIKQPCFDACFARSISAESVTLLVLHCSDTAAAAEIYSHFNCGVYSRKCKVCGASSLREHCCNHSGFFMGLMIKNSAFCKKWYAGFMCILHFSCKKAWLFMETTEIQVEK